MRLDVRFLSLKSTSFHSKELRFSSNKINPTWCALKDSHGHESPAHKLFMRYTGRIRRLIVSQTSFYFSFYC